MEIPAPAKINLSLDITGRRPDGYHVLDMVMQSVSLYDVVSLEEATGREGICIRCGEGDVPCGKENTVFRAAEAFFQATGARRKNSLIFTIRKNIPRQAGLGGGSADAAAALNLLNRMFRTDLSGNQMREIALYAGADVPFCVEGGTARVGGIGETIEGLAPMIACDIVICKPDVGISTKEAYRCYDSGQYPPTSYTAALLEAMKTKKLEKLGCALGNAFESAGVPSQISAIEKEMIRCGSVGSCMSGSGSAVFGLFADSVKAEQCRSLLLERYSAVFLCHPAARQPLR